jgi:branched-chain amino acid transport system ATP-binding protein
MTTIHSAEASMLKVEALQASYGQSQVLFDISLEVNRGEVVTVLGRNGMGKTTTIRAIMGMTPPHGGSVHFLGKPLRGLPPFRIAKLGLGLVPEGRYIFPSLTVWENLTATAANGASGKPRWTTDPVLELFPWIAERRSQMGGQLSGGEQQMLAIARALMTNPELLILDEATEGLAPIIRQEVWRVIHKLKASGQAILIIDKNLQVLARLADRHYVLERGRVRWSGSSVSLGADLDTIRRYVGV